MRRGEEPRSRGAAAPQQARELGQRGGTAMVTRGEDLMALPGVGRGCEPPKARPGGGRQRSIFTPRQNATKSVRFFASSLGAG
jgi:hypothetical protein